MRGEHEVLSRRAELLQAELAASRSSRETAEADRDRLTTKADALRAKVEEARALPVRSYRGLGMALAVVAVLLGTGIAWLARAPEPAAPVQTIPRPSHPGGDFHNPRRCADRVDCAPSEDCVLGTCTSPGETKRRVVPGR